PLPYAMDALAPHISQETLEYHYGKHHQTYVTNLNKAIEGTDEANKPLEDIIMSAEGPKFNNAAQVWNHTFYWNSMKPGGGGEPPGEAANKPNGAAGRYGAYKDKSAGAATPHFGSGWAGPLDDGAKPDVGKPPNAPLPMKHGQKALLTIDVWEHAYYIDF